MSTPFPLFPPSASSVAMEMDLLYLFIVAVSAFFAVLVTALVVFFTIRYRRTHPDQIGADIHGSLVLELTWTFIPFVLAMVMFGWGAKVFFDLARPPRDAMATSRIALRRGSRTFCGRSLPARRSSYCRISRFPSRRAGTMPSPWAMTARARNSSFGLEPPSGSP